ncbi:MAG: WXG100 family type VII secretion target [Actinomycetota bacterium]|nr:WXG100 family type VII secretion target [Actinomycetota bacterium]
MAVVPGSEPSLAYSENFNNYSHKQLKAMLDMADPGSVRATAASWEDLGNSLASRHADLTDGINALSQAWEGAAAQAYTQKIQDLATTSLAAAQTSFKTRDALYDSADALARAKSSMPPPYEKSTAVDIGAGLATLPVGGLGFFAAKAYQDQQAADAKQNAVRVMTDLGNKYSAADSSIPPAPKYAGPAGVAGAGQPAGFYNNTTAAPTGGTGTTAAGSSRYVGTTAPSGVGAGGGGNGSGVGGLGAQTYGGSGLGSGDSSGPYVPGYTQVGTTPAGLGGFGSTVSGSGGDFGGGPSLPGGVGGSSAGLSGGGLSGGGLAGAGGLLGLGAGAGGFAGGSGLIERPGAGSRGGLTEFPGTGGRVGAGVPPGGVLGENSAGTGRFSGGGRYIGSSGVIGEGGVGGRGIGGRFPGAGENGLGLSGEGVGSSGAAGGPGGEARAAGLLDGEAMAGRGAPGAMGEGAATGRGGYPPMMGGGMGGGGGGNSRKRKTWLIETDDVWSPDDVVSPPVLGDD